MDWGQGEGPRLFGEASKAWPLLQAWHLNEDGALTRERERSIWAGASSLCPDTRGITAFPAAAVKDCDRGGSPGPPDP